jgi:hypothetical protein
MATEVLIVGLPALNRFVQCPQYANILGSVTDEEFVQFMSKE